MTATRLVAMDFETGRITAWARVPGGRPHRVLTMGPYDPAQMREFPFDRDQIEELRARPVDFLAKRQARRIASAPEDDEPGPEAA